MSLEYYNKARKRKRPSPVASGVPCANCTWPLAPPDRTNCQKCEKYLHKDCAYKNQKRSLCRKCFRVEKGLDNPNNSFESTSSSSSVRTPGNTQPKPRVLTKKRPRQARPPTKSRKGPKSTNSNKNFKDIKTWTPGDVKAFVSRIGSSSRWANLAEEFFKDEIDGAMLYSWSNAKAESPILNTIAEDYNLKKSFVLSLLDHIGRIPTSGSSNNACKGKKEISSSSKPAQSKQQRKKNKEAFRGESSIRRNNEADKSNLDPTSVSPTLKLESTEMDQEYNYNELSDPLFGDELLQKGYDHFYGNDFQTVDEKKGKEFIIRAARMQVLTALGDCSSEGWDGLQQSKELALQFYKRAIDEKDCPMAHTNLADIYTNDKGDMQLALTHYDKAIAAGDVTACCNLGRMYLVGDSIEKNIEKGIELLGRASDKGCSAAHLELGEHYHNNENHPLAFYHFEAAAKQGQPDAQYNLAVYYENGWVKNKKADKKLSRSWHERAASRGKSESLQVIANHHYSRRSYKKAYELYRRAAGNGYPPAMNSLAICKEWGMGTAKDLKGAITCYEMAAKDGSKETSAQALTRLGNIFYRGRKTQDYTVTKDFERAADYFEEASFKGNSEAMSAIGHCYYEGKGRRVSITNALRWFTKSAKGKNKNLEALLCLGDIFYHGQKDIPIDYRKAIKYYSQAARQHKQLSAMNDASEFHIWHKLGYCYFHGLGIKRDLCVAKKWLEKAAKAGHVESRTFLECIQSGRHDSKHLQYKRDPKARYADDSISDDEDEDGIEEPSSDDGDIMIDSDDTAEKDPSTERRQQKHRPEAESGISNEGLETSFETTNSSELNVSGFTNSEGDVEKERQSAINKADEKQMSQSDYMVKEEILDPLSSEGGDDDNSDAQLGVPIDSIPTLLELDEVKLCLNDEVRVKEETNIHSEVKIKSESSSSHVVVKSEPLQFQPME